MRLVITFNHKRGIKFVKNRYDWNSVITCENVSMKDDTHYEKKCEKSYILCYFINDRRYPLSLTPWCSWLLYYISLKLQGWHLRFLNSFYCFHQFKGKVRLKIKFPSCFLFLQFLFIQLLLNILKNTWVLNSC